MRSADPARRLSRHHARVGPVSGLCVLCRDELYERLAAEYTALTTDAIHKREENTMTTASPEPPDGDLLPELYESQSATPATLFGDSDLARALDKMAEIAKLLIGVVEQRNLVKRISGNDYLFRTRLGRARRHDRPRPLHRLDKAHGQRRRVPRPRRGAQDRGRSRRLSCRAGLHPRRA